MERWSCFLAAVLLAALSASAAPLAPSNAGLKPTRLDAYGRVHDYQLATEPVVGTMVRLLLPAAAAACQVPPRAQLCAGS